MGPRLAAVIALKTALERHQFCVLMVDDNLEALIHDEHPDLALLDGFTAATYAVQCQKLKRVGPGLPVILLTVESVWDRLVGTEVEASVDDVVFKPISDFKLATRLHFQMKTLHQMRVLVEHNLFLTREQQNNAPIALLKDNIVSSVSHELRTPLLQVKSAVAMLAESTRTIAPNRDNLIRLNEFVDEAIRLTGFMTAATSKLEGVVQDLTQLAQAVNIKREPFQLHDAISLATRQLSRRWESSEQVGRIQVTFDKQFIVMGDRGGVAQVLQQLLDNAIKFSSPGAPIAIDASQTDQGVWIAVSDKGIGIAADQVDKIFQAFYQVDGGPTRSFGGVGIGLAIVKLILDALGSPIDVQSQPGIGSTFRFLLPLVELE
ncbi:MAG TPA: ATP-binding protein [Aggregatilineales bacterium]|nr:ATP-binding protein [Aggregatilineales bacterium]